MLRDAGYLDTAFTAAEGVVPDLRRINRPVGPVAVFAASNFPFAFSVVGGDTASALAAGLPGRGEGARGTPGHLGPDRGDRAGALASAGAPAGTFGLVHGVQAGVRLLQHPAIAAAGFTGSTAGGLALARIAAERPVPIPFYGELGSVNPCVVLPGAAFARPAAVATGYVGSLTLGSGQFCTNPGLLFVPEDVGLLSAISEAAGALGGRRDAVRPDLRGLPERRGRGGPATPASPSWRSASPVPGPWGATPRVFQVTLKEFAADLAVLSRERFGPAGLVITYPSVEDLLLVLAALAGNLVGTVHVDTDSAEDLELARPVIAASSGSRAGSSATAGRPASPWSPPSTTAAHGRPPPFPPTPRSAPPRSAAGWSPWPTRTSRRSCSRRRCAANRAPTACGTCAACLPFTSDHKV